MRLAHYYLPEIGGCWGVADEAGRLRRVGTDVGAGGAFLAALLQWPDPAAVLRQATGPEDPPLEALAAAAPDPSRPHLLAPLDLQEVWAAGVTYLRSKIARMEESAGGAAFYDRVYDAPRPELFFKATPSRVSGPNAPVRLRADAAWNVPEPEVALLLSPDLRLVGYTIGNDVSSRDIEGENPLYLPQAKLYRQSCSLGPVIRIETEPREHRALELSLEIRRAGEVVYAGAISTAQMKRSFRELAEWLGRDNIFPHGVFLLTGTGLVPEETFTLRAGDEVRIAVAEIGVLANPVVQGGA